MKNLRTILAEEGLIKVATPRGRSLSEAHAEILPGDTVEVVGRSNKGERGKVVGQDKDSSGLWIYLDSLDGAGVRPHHVRVLKPFGGRKPLRNGDQVQVVGGRKAPKGFTGEVVDIISNADGRHLLLDSGAAKVWVNAKHVLPSSEGAPAGDLSSAVGNLQRLIPPSMGKVTLKRGGLTLTARSPSGSKWWEGVPPGLTDFLGKLVRRLQLGNPTLRVVTRSGVETMKISGSFEGFLFEGLAGVGFRNSGGPLMITVHMALS